MTRGAVRARQRALMTAPPQGAALPGAFLARRARPVEPACRARYQEAMSPPPKSPPRARATIAPDVPLAADAPLANAPEYSVSEISGAVKRLVEDQFGHVRVRGEIGRVSRPASGHIYLDLKDERAVLAGVIWKGTAARLSTKPEQGLEVIATGRLTTYPGQSKYQMVIEALEPAGAGALMALLEQRRKALAAEGLFAEARKKPLPFLPSIIGVVTSPSGAVIRDILHRLQDRFPRHVLIWPTRVQGETAAAEVAAGIRGFNALAPGGPIPRPDLIIVARGGGSVEDLWPFNEEVVVRAAAESEIPLISAVGHETDTTLIDFAADWRAPTPTAAAERAVPVRADLVTQVLELARRQHRAMTRRLEAARGEVRALARALPQPARLLEMQRQRLDIAADRLLRARARLVAERRQSLAVLAGRLEGARPQARLARARKDIEALSARLHRLPPQRLRAARAALAPLAQRLPRALAADLGRFRQRLDSATRLLTSLSYEGVLQRGFVLALDAEGRPLREAAAARAAGRFELVFQRDERVPVRVDDDGGTLPAPSTPGRRKPAAAAARARAKPSGGKPAGKGQGELF